MDIQILTVSPEGNVQLPESMRKELYLHSGDQLAILVNGDSMMLKPIRPLSSEYFKNRSEEPANPPVYREEEVNEVVSQVIRKVRDRKRT